MPFTVSRLPSTQSPRILAIVGPTASGKSDLALKLAKKFNGEVICADSRTIYKDMDLGTAKPTREQQVQVPHWGLDLIEPGEIFSAAQFKKYAQDKIKDIQSRGRLPIMVGGTGLYIDGVLFNFSFIARPGLAMRGGLEKLSTQQLQKIIRRYDYPMPENSRNRRHLIRTIERQGQTGSKRTNLPEGVLLIGLLPSDDVLRRRINERAEAIFAKGVVEETKRLVKKYGEEAISKTAGIVYRICLQLIKGQFARSEAKERFKKEDWQYARRQKTWFKRNPHIQWFDSEKRAYERISEVLST